MFLPRKFKNLKMFPHRKFQNVQMFPSRKFRKRKQVTSLPHIHIPCLLIRKIKPTHRRLGTIIVLAQRVMLVQAVTFNKLKT